MATRVARRATAALLWLLAPALAPSAQSESMSEDRGHVYRWNKFTDDLYALHQRQVAGREVRIEEETGGYPGQPGFYREERYFDADTDRLLGIIQWEAASPDTIHSISVFRYDEAGRLIRDYSSTYLPDYRNAPTQTLIFIHRYRDELHAFRSFDASDDLLYERCEGRFQGGPVFISLDIDEIEDAQGERYRNNSGILTEPVYAHCFGDMPDSAAHLLPPR